ncbi:MAG: MFS transporter [Deltaproteobacteria bacterium]|nr:MFS transporter [Deltaproteobacteria bacterium]
MRQQQVLPQKFFNPRNVPYAWVIVASCALMVGLTYGLIYSYSVFFKPLANHFDWNRATVSFIYSLALIIRGTASVIAGYFADRYGPRKTMLVCGVLMGAGFLLCGRVTALWQFFISYAVVEAFGMSGIFGIGTALVSQWFNRNRGLALGIVASGSGLGTFFIVPGAERLIDALDWSRAYTVIGYTSGALMIAATLFLRRPASPLVVPEDSRKKGPPIHKQGATVLEALRDIRFYLIMLSFLPFFFGIQMVMVHLVNYATDGGIDPLVAATFVSVIGIVSVAGRLSSGVISDRLGIYTSLLMTCISLIVSFVLLIYTRAPWSFYLFAVIFSFPYGGEVTQIPIVIGQYFGTRAMATLMGMVLFIISIGGAAGSWAAGKLFDVTGSYVLAFITGAVAAAASMIMVLLLRWQDLKSRK